MKLNQKIKVSVLGLIYCLSLGTYAFADDNEQKVTKKNVPSAISASFVKSYPHASIIGYSKEMKNGKAIYEVESKDSNTKRTISYSAKGQVLEIEEVISSTSLPTNIIQSINKSYPKAKIIVAERITSGNSIKYEVEIKNNNKTKELVFDGNNKVKKVVEREHENNEKSESGEKGEDK